MKIQAITATSRKKPSFKERNFDRGVTVKDLYETEKEIIANQQELIAKQNAAIAKALIYMNTGKQDICSSECKNPEKIINKIMHNDENKQVFYYDPRFGEEAAKYLND